MKYRHMEDYCVQHGITSAYINTNFSTIYTSVLTMNAVALSKTLVKEGGRSTLHNPKN